MGPRLRVPEQPASDCRRTGVRHRPHAGRSTSPVPAASASASRTSSSGAPTRTSAGWTSATPSRCRSGAHLIKIGARLQPRVRRRSTTCSRKAASYAYSNRVDFITDYTAQAQASDATRTYTSFNQGVGPTAFSFHTFDYDFFIQDTWRLNPRTTLNLGLRYDYEQMPDPQIPNPLLPATSAFPNDKNNFGPRIGVAYDLSGHGTTVLRGGYGMFYGRIINSTISNAITNVGSTPGSWRCTLQTTSAGAPTFPNVLASASATPVRPDIVVFGDGHPEPARARVGRDPRAAPRRQHDGLGLVRRQRRPQPAAVHRHQPAAAVGHGQLSRDRRPARRSDRDHADLHRRAAEPELRPDHDDLRHRRFEVQRPGPAAESAAEQGPAVPGELHRSAGHRQRPESQTFTSANNVLNPYDLGPRGGHVELRDPAPVRRATPSGTPTSARAAACRTRFFSGFTIAPTLAMSSGRALHRRR